MLCVQENSDYYLLWVWYLIDSCFGRKKKANKLLNRSTRKYLNYSNFKKKPLVSVKWSALFLYQCFFKINFYWSIVALQCCGSFCCTAKWFSYMYILCIHVYNMYITYIYIKHTYVHSLFLRFPFHIGHYRALCRVLWVVQ